MLCPIRLSILYIIAVICCYPVSAQQAKNPLLEMIGREPRGVYHDAYEALCDSLFAGDSLARAELERLFAEAAAADPSGEWELDR